MASSSHLNQGDFLVVILDLNMLAWSDLSTSPDGTGIALDTALDTLLIFVNAHLAIRHENASAVYVATPGSSELLFSTMDMDLPRGEAPRASDGSTYQRFRVVDEVVIRRLKSTVAKRDSGSDRPTALVGAVAKALSHLNRATNLVSQERPHSRLLVISVSTDSSGQYIPLMNCIFASQKADIPIDVCRIATDDAVFWQQAAYLTAGNYYRLQQPAGLLQTLMMSFLPGWEARKRLYLPRQEQVDLRAACFCHRKIIDLGYVCSVCLSIFCSPTAWCTTCRTKFPLATLKRFKPVAAAASNGNGKGKPAIPRNA